MQLGLAGGASCTTNAKTTVVSAQGLQHADTHETKKHIIIHINKCAQSGHIHLPGLCILWVLLLSLAALLQNLTALLSSCLSSLSRGEPKQLLQLCEIRNQIAQLRLARLKGIRFPGR